MPFSHPLRVRYAECDPQGVVFNANYLAYFDISLTELWRAAFGGYHVMLQRGVDLVVAEAGVRFRSPARFDDELELQLEIARLGETAITGDHTILRVAGGERAEQLPRDVVAEGQTRHVVVDAGTHRKVPIPDWLRDGLTPYSSS